MKFQMRLLIALNIVLAASVAALLVIAIPGQADAAKSPRLKVFYSKIEFPSTHPCKRNAGYITQPSKRSADLEVLHDGGSWDIEYVSDIETRFVNDRYLGWIYEFVDHETEHFSKSTLYACTMRVVTGATLK